MALSSRPSEELDFPPTDYQSKDIIPVPVWPWFLGAVTLKRSPNRSVRDEWLARLPDEKDVLFRTAQARFEACYRMLSVALDETLSLREQGQLPRARAEAAMCDELFQNLVAGLLESLGALEAHARHFGTQPAVEPLEVGFFRGEPARRLSAWNTLLHHVLFAGRSRWFHKLQSLREILADVGGEFHETATELNQGTAIEPARLWDSLEALHDDLNTCLREIVIMLKCFLRALPTEQVRPFRSAFEPAPHSKRAAGLSLAPRTAG